MNWGLYYLVARRWALMAVLPVLFVGALTYAYTSREPKTYQTTATLYVEEPSANATVPGSTDVYTSQAVVPTYTQMVGLPVIAANVNRAMARRYPGYTLATHSLKVAAAGSIAGSVQTGSSTQLMNITDSDTVPVRAAAAANAVAGEFINQIAAIQRSKYMGGAKAIQHQIDMAEANIQVVSQRIGAYRGSSSGLNNLKSQLAAYESIYGTLLASLQGFSIARDTALHAVRVFSAAPVPTTPTGPHPLQSALTFMFVALVLCAGAIFLYDYLDDTPRTPEEIAEIVDSPILGTVHKFDQAQYGTQLVTARDARSPLAEAYRVIRTNIQFTEADKPPRVIVVTSSSPSEGKSTTVSNLAHVVAEAGRRVALVDADLRCPSLHRVFDVDRRNGLTNMLATNEHLNGHGSQPTQQPNLALIASGPMPPRPADLLSSSRMRQVLTHLESEHDLVLVDSPPVLAVTDAAILSTITDGVILVVDPARSKRRDLRRAREAIEAVNGRILGVVINKLSRHESGYYYYYHQHNYAYRYGYSYGARDGDDIGSNEPAGRV